MSQWGFVSILSEKVKRLACQPSKHTTSDDPCVCVDAGTQACFQVSSAVEPQEQRAAQRISSADISDVPQGWVQIQNT